MNRDTFASNRIEGRRLLLRNIVESFRELRPVAVHLFGSGPQGFKDEFSDIDVWITFKDEDIEHALQCLASTFKGIAPVIVRHHSKTWSPIGGSANSVIHYASQGLFVVDYYVSKLSETQLKTGSKVLYGDDSIKRGDWKLNRQVDEKMKDTHTIRKDIDLLIDLIFVSFKGIIRKWENDAFVDTLKAVHKAFRERYPGKLPARRLSLSFRSNYSLLNDIYLVANKRQQKAIKKVLTFGKQVERLYAK